MSSILTVLMTFANNLSCSLKESSEMGLLHKH
jgi:hypothetical protein